MELLITKANAEMHPILWCIEPAFDIYLVGLI
jgi:hypothetical protein